LHVPVELELTVTTFDINLYVIVDCH